MNQRKYASRGMNTLKGFLAGSLIIGSVINPYSILVQVILFLVGLLILLNAILIYGRNVHPGTTSVMAIIGALLAIIFTVIGYAHFYIAIIFVVTVILYIYISITRHGVLSEHTKHEEKGE